MSSIITAIALALQATVPSPTPSSPVLTPAEGADARCIVIYGFLGSRSDPAQAEQIRMATIYFVGKLRARNPSLDIAAAVGRAADDARSRGVNAQAEGQRCGADFDASVRSLSGVKATPAAPAAKP